MPRRKRNECKSEFKIPNTYQVPYAHKSHGFTCFTCCVSYFILMQFQDFDMFLNVYIFYLEVQILWCHNGPELCVLRRISTSLKWFVVTKQSTNDLLHSGSAIQAHVHKYYCCYSFILIFFLCTLLWVWSYVHICKSKPEINSKMVCLWACVCVCDCC